MLRATFITVTFWTGLIGLCLLAAAQEPGSVEGAVYHTGTYDGVDVPVARLSATLVSRQDGQQIDSKVISGTYVTFGVPPGSYDLTFGESAAFGATIRRIELAAGERKQLPPVGLLFHPGCVDGDRPPPQYLELLPVVDREHGTLSGTVVDNTNNALIAGVEVSLYVMGNSSGSTQLARSVTDSEGQYKFDGLAVGKYWVRFQTRAYFQDDYGAKGYLLVQAGFDSTYPPFALERCKPGKCEPSMRRIETLTCE